MASRKEFSEDDTAVLKTMYLGYRKVEDIAEKLGRSKGCIIQKARRMGLKRDHNLVKLVNKHGFEYLEHASNREEFHRVMAERRQAQKNAKERQRAITQAIALEALVEDLKVMDRNAAIKRAFAFGATLAQIGAEVGISKQAVGHVVKPPKRRSRATYGYGKQ